LARADFGPSLAAALAPLVAVDGADIELTRRVSGSIATRSGRLTRQQVMAHHGASP
jgi:hypothetical protein